MAVQLKLAIAGAGAITDRAHIPALKTIAAARIVAIQSRTRGKAERLAGSHFPANDRPRTYDNYDEMLQRERPDAVCVFTPNRYHCEYALKALAIGAHVLVEKPMAPTAAECRKMVDTAARAGRVLMVAMQRRYGSYECAVKRAIDVGAIGRPTFIRARLSHGGPDTWAPGQSWFYDPVEAGGGAMLDLGVHVSDLALWFMGEAASVVGQVATVGPQAQVDESGAMVVRFRSGALGVIEASWSSTPGLSSMEIYGTDGRIMVGYPRFDIAVQRSDGSDAPGFSRDDILSGFDPRDLLAPFRALAANFVAAAQGHADPAPTGTDGMRAIELVEACYLSSRTGSRVNLPLE
ncbi:MAG: Gfo/Idh/MocA family protein [Candidatus Binataceae bacterium]